MKRDALEYLAMSLLFALFCGLGDVAARSI